MEIDGTDRKLIDLLQANARMSFAELGRRVRLSTPAVIERVKRLEDAGVILGYNAQVNPAAVGLPLAAIVRVTVAGDRLVRFGKQVKEISEVLECYRITGSDSYLVRVAVRDTEHLEQVVDSMMPYIATNTSLVLAAPVPWRPVTPAQEIAGEVRSARQVRRGRSGEEEGEKGGSEKKALPSPGDVG